MTHTLYAQISPFTGTVHVTAVAPTGEVHDVERFETEHHPRSVDERYVTGLLRDGGYRIAGEWHTHRDGLRVTIRRQSV